VREGIVGEGVKVGRSEGIGGVQEEVVHWGMSSEILGLGRRQYAEVENTLGPAAVKVDTGAQQMTSK
jgi:hypothetical protein